MQINKSLWHTTFQLMIAAVMLVSCSKDKTENNPPIVPVIPVVPDTLYFPPVTGNEWQTTSASSLGWDTSRVTPLYDYLQSKNTKAFIVLKNGKIVFEKYFGSFIQDSIWYWASAGKTITAMLVGIAQQEGLLSIQDKTSDYLGTGWTSLPINKENLISIRHQLTMTSGLEDDVADKDCTIPSCLTYLADAGTRWAYHNAPYTLLEKVVENASGQTYNQYFQQKIRNRIGMNGLWARSGSYNNVYFSNARSMARFGLLMLNKGRWSQTPIISDSVYFNAQVNSSQTFNLSYGYLTWLNGKSSHMIPILRNVFSGTLVQNAPADMYAALGKNDQKMYVVPSQKLVVIRMGETAGNVQLAVSSFDSELWGKIREVIRY